jgi:hypothetical protein
MNLEELKQASDMVDEAKHLRDLIETYQEAECVVVGTLRARKSFAAEVTKRQKLRNKVTLDDQEIRDAIVALLEQRLAVAVAAVQDLGVATDDSDFACTLQFHNFRVVQ